MKPKTVQIPEALFIDLLKYHLWSLDDDEIAARIQRGLQDKMDAITRRRYYTDSKTAPTAEERERARQAYLDEIGMQDDFRWPEDFDPNK